MFQSLLFCDSYRLGVATAAEPPAVDPSAVVPLPPIVIGVADEGPSPLFGSGVLPAPPDDESIIQFVDESTMILILILISLSLYTICIDYLYIYIYIGDR